jgi:uncharacterized protein YaaN involved in tellurite resistance
LGVDLASVRRELEAADPQAGTESPPTDTELSQRAQELAVELLRVDPAVPDASAEARSTVDSLGRDLQTQAAHRSKLLTQPVKDLARRADDGGPVARALVDLRVQVEALDPNRLDFSPGWRTRFLGMIPGLGTPLKRYFSKYENAQTVIDGIIKSLESGREQLKRDNITLDDDQQEMRNLTGRLKRQVELGRLLDLELDRQLSGALAGNPERRGFVQEELQFPLRQRTMDLQQQLVVCQQGVLATEIVIRNNRELIRGVDRSIDVTISALNTAVTVALALAHQRIVLDKIEAVSQTTSEIIAGTGERLRTQGTAIHTQAAGTMLDMDALRSAFADISAALDEISRFRRDALPAMAQTIVEFNELTEAAEGTIGRLDQARANREAIELDGD